jgi:GlpG protein
MRQVANHADESTARLFADVLCARGIDVEVSKTREGTWAVWVLDEGRVESAREAWTGFEANPGAPEHAAARGSLKRKQGEMAAEGRASRHEIIDIRRRWPPAGGTAVLTIVLIAASVLVTALVSIGKKPELADWLFIGRPDEIVFGRQFFYVLHGQPWRLVTPILLHLSFLHILFNMWWLADLGSLIERRIGSWWFLLLVLSTAVISNVSQYAWTGSPFFGGMSGVIYALFGYVWMRGRLDPNIGFFVSTSAAVILLAWLAFGFTGQLGPVANVAHLSGLVSGVLLGAAAGFAKPHRRS